MMQRTDSFWLRPCPKCGDMKPVAYAEGNAKKVFQEDGSTEMFFLDAPSYWCECTCCGAITEPQMTVGDAIGAWNNKELRDTEGKPFYE